MNLQFFGGRGASGELSDGPSGGGDSSTKWGQPNTPIEPPAPTIDMQIGKKGQPVSADTAIKVINPYRNIEYGDYSENCQRCAVAFELNRRGYAVQASETSENDPYPRNNNYLKAFKNPTITNVGATTNDKVNANILKNMKNWGVGSRAIVKVQYNASSGHAFNVEYKSGKLHYYDAQTGQRYDPKKVFAHVRRNSVQIVRTDNLQLDDDVRNLVRKRKR